MMQENSRNPGGGRELLAEIFRAAGASVLLSLSLAGCGGGFGGTGNSSFNTEPPAPTVVGAESPRGADDISDRNRRQVAESVSKMNLGGTAEVAPEEIGVSHRPEILNRNPFASDANAPNTNAPVARSVSRKSRGYKAFEFAVPESGAIMTIAVWISETPPPGRTDSGDDSLYVRMQVYIAPQMLGLVSDDEVQELETQEVQVQIRNPKPKPDPKPTVTVAPTVSVPTILGPADGLCPAGTLPANEISQDALDQNLISAALANDLEGACENLRRGADVNAEKRVARGVMETALIVAASYGRMELARLLIRNGAEVNLGGEHSRWRKDRITPLMAASGLGRLAMAEFLISQGAEIDAVDTRGRGALYEAAHSGRWAIVEMLLARGADANLQEGWGETPLYGALVGWDGYGQEGYAAETLNWVRERGATRNPDGIASWVKVINALLAGGAEVNIQRTTHNWAGPGRAAALDYAARLGHSEFARILREADGKCFVEAGPLCGDEMVAVELSSSGWGLFYAQSSGRGGSMFFEQGEVMRGATVIFTAAPSEGNYLLEWSGDCAAVAADVGDASSAAEKYCALVAEKDLKTGAVFAAAPVGLSCPGGSLPDGGRTQAELNRGLRLAARGGDAAKVCEWLRRGADADDTLDGDEESILHEAVRGGHLAAAEILLANGAAANPRKEGQGPSPLDVAAKNDAAEIAALLREAGGLCFLETGSLCGEVPVAGPGPVTILATVAAGNVCPAGTLSANGLTQAELNLGLLDAVHDAGDNGNWNTRKKAEICEWLRRGADINACSYGRHACTPLYHVAWATPLGDSRDNFYFSEIVEFLIANGADVNNLIGGGELFTELRSPLFIVRVPVVYTGENRYAEMEEIMGILLKNGADVHLKNDYGRTALLHVIEIISRWSSKSFAEGYGVVVGMLLDAGSNPDAKDNKGRAALHRLAKDGDLPGIAELLLRRGADVNVMDSHDDTPLHHVVRGRIFSSYSSEVRMSIAALFLEHGADVLARNAYGMTPLQFARDWGRGSNVPDDKRQWYSAMIDLMEATLPSPTVAVAARSAPVSDSSTALRKQFASAFNPGPAFGDSFGAVSNGSGGSGSFVSGLGSLRRTSGGAEWESFPGWRAENEFGRAWFSMNHRGDHGFGFGGAWNGSPFAALSGSGVLAGGETSFGGGALRLAAFGDYGSGWSAGESGRWAEWAARGTAIETAMSAAESVSGLAENRTRGALTEFHLGDSDGLGFALQAGALSESESVLSGTSRGSDLRGLRSRTAFGGASGSADLPGGWRLLGSAHLGRSWTESDGILRSGDLWASSFSAGLGRGDWLYFGDEFILRISQPLRVERWERELVGEVGAGGAGGLRRLGASPSGRQLDAEMAYRLRFGSDGVVSFSAGWRLEAGHSRRSSPQAGALFSAGWGF